MGQIRENNKQSHGPQYNVSDKDILTNGGGPITAYMEGKEEEEEWWW